MAFSSKALCVLALLFAGLSFCGAVTLPLPSKTNCTSALALSRTYATAATAAVAAANASLNLAVTAQAQANALANSSAAVLASVEARATVKAASKLCVIGIAHSSAKSIATAFSLAEASARAAADAFVAAFAATKAASVAQARAMAGSCSCSDLEVEKELRVAQSAFSSVQSSALMFRDVMAHSEDQRHKVALILAKVAARAAEVAVPQCVSCRTPGRIISSSFQKSANGSVANASSFVQTSGGTSSFVSTSSS